MVAEEGGLYWPDLLLYHALLVYNDFRNVNEEEIKKVAKDMVRYKFIISYGEGDTKTERIYTFDAFYDLLKSQYEIKFTKPKELIGIRELASYVQKIEEEEDEKKGETYSVQILYLSVTDLELWEKLDSTQQQYYDVLSYTLPYQFGLVDEGGNIKRPPIVSSEFAWPAPDLTEISSGFGMRWLDGVQDNHTGVDLNLPGEADYGKDVIAAADGVVYQVTKASGKCGFNIRITHGEDWQTRYCHLSKIFVEPGQTVEQGDVIGLVGNTGNVTGSHLHFEMKYKGVLVDPLPYIIATRPR